MKQGFFTSVGNSLVSGTVADLFDSSERGLPMNIFTLATFTGQVSHIHVMVSFGCVIFGWVVQYLGFQWVYGVNLSMAPLKIYSRNHGGHYCNSEHLAHSRDEGRYHIGEENAAGNSQAT